MRGDSYRDSFEGCQTHEDYRRRFQEILQQEIGIAGYVAEYLEARSNGGQTEIQARSALPPPETPLGERVEDLRVVVEILLAARQASQSAMTEGD
jgi:hypothetical protein